MVTLFRFRVYIQGEVSEVTMTPGWCLAHLIFFGAVRSLVKMQTINLNKTAGGEGGTAISE